MADDDPDCLLWFVAVDNRQREWPVYIAHPDECDGLMGFTDGLVTPGAAEPRSQRRILINAAYSLASQDMTLLHELVHASADGNVFSEHTEEEFVRLIERPLHAILRKHGGLRWPRRPRGTAALMKRSKGKR